MANIEFYDKDKNRTNVDGNLQFDLQRLKRKANGGNDQLFFDITGDDVSLDAFLQNMLGKLIKVYDDNLCDEGYFSIETIDRFKDGVNYRRSISDMFNSTKSMVHLTRRLLSPILLLRILMGFVQK